MPFSSIIEALSDKYIFSAFILSLITIIVILLIFMIRHKLNKKITGKKYLSKFETPVILLGVVLATDVVINKIINTADSFIGTVKSLNNTLLIIAFTYLLMILADIVIHKWSLRLNKTSGSKAHEEIVPLMISVKNILLVILAIFLVLQAWGIQIAALAASVGVLGVILGFVFKDTLSNIFSGISFIMDDSFKKGDLVELQDGVMGYVKEINLRSTKIVDFNSEEVIVPNSLIANMRIKNYAHPTKSIRIIINFSVAYGTKTEKVHKVILSLLKGRKEILKHPVPKVFFLEMADYSLKFTTFFFIKDYAKMFKIKSDVTTAIYNTLTKNKIKIPFPTRTIYYKK